MFIDEFVRYNVKVFRAVRLSSTNRGDWEAIFRSGMNSSFMHSRDFLDMFDEDYSLIVYEDEVPKAIFPAAKSIDTKIICSHPKASYGGLVFSPSIGGNRLSNACVEIAFTFQGMGFNHLEIKLIPQFYSRHFGGEELASWLNIGSIVKVAKVSSFMDLETFSLSNLRKRTLKKFNSWKGFCFTEEHNDLRDVYDAATYTLRHKRGVQPVHTLQEIEYLADKGFVRTFLLTDGGSVPAAGIILFKNSANCVVQYWGSCGLYSNSGALDYLLMRTIEKLRAQSRYLVLGVSNRPHSKEIDDGVYAYKKSLGAQTMTTFELSLDLNRLTCNSKQSSIK